MVPVQAIARGLQELQQFFNHQLNPTQLEHYLAQLPPWFDDEYDWQFSVNESMKRKFFPSIQELIEIANGTLEDRALWEWNDHQLLSAVGRRALNSVGGIYAVKTSDNPSKLKSDFIQAYKSFAKGAKPADFKPVGIAKLPPPKEDKPAPGTPVKPIPVLGDDINRQLGIQHDGKRPYTEWEILLHKCWGAFQFGTIQQQERCRQMAQEWGREFPKIPPLNWRGNVKISVPMSDLQTDSPF